LPTVGKPNQSYTLLQGQPCRSGGPFRQNGAKTHGPLVVSADTRWLPRSFLSWNGLFSRVLPAGVLSVNFYCRARLEAMRTKLIQNPISAIPSLEHIPANGGPPERTILEEFPFSVGRSESCDLRIDSDRVSREHAIIVEEGGRFRVRDPGSTNGTFLNGRQINEAPINDGDILLIADVELTFLVGRRQRSSSAVTQAIDFGPAAERTGTGPVAIIRQVRRFHEALTHRCIDNLFQPIAALENGQVLGHEAVEESDCPEDGWMKAQKVLLSTECRLTSRIRQLRRMLAAEESLGFPAGTSVFLKVHSSEIGDDRLLESLLDLRKAIRREQRIVIEIPDSAVSDTSYFGRFHDRLAEACMGIAYHDFTGGPSHLVRHRAVSPDFVKLAPSLVPSVNGNGHDRRQLQAIVQAGEELGCQVIATAIDSEEDADICRDLGCQFGQGDYLGIPKPIGDLVVSC
jgi:EAL domain-containing protein (putative c-di-GMP-specific phosphodiesterase class I)